MRARSCPTPAALSRAFALGADAALAAHIGVCSACRADWAALQALRALGQALPCKLPTRVESEALRARLLRATTAAPAPKRRPVLVLVGAAAACLLFLGGVWLGYYRGHLHVAALRGTVQPRDGAAFVHQRIGEKEWVRLREGAIRVEVERLARGERFLVITGDGEVEVRGTAFAVQAVHDHLRSIEVEHGRVEVRRAGQPSLLLSAGERWQTRSVGDAPPSPPPPSVPPAVAPVPDAIADKLPPSSTARREATPVLTPPSFTLLNRSRRRRDPPLASAAGSATPVERAFTQGFTALRRSDFAGASAAFRRAIARGSGEPVLEDARFWLAVALARDGQREAAITALGDFVNLHPTSSRRGEASSILGWQLLQAGRRRDAERCFRDAAADPSAEIQRSARAGLAALGN